MTPDPPPRRSWQKSVWERIKFAFPCQDELLSGSVLWEIGNCFKNLDELWHFIPMLTLPAKILFAASRLCNALRALCFNIFRIHHNADKFPFDTFIAFRLFCLHLLTGFKSSAVFLAGRTRQIQILSVTWLRPRRRPTQDHFPFLNQFHSHCLRVNLLILFCLPPIKMNHVPWRSWRTRRRHNWNAISEGIRRNWSELILS